MIKILIFGTIIAVATAIGFPTAPPGAPVEIASLRLVSESAGSNVAGLTTCSESVVTREIRTINCYVKKDRKESFNREIPEVRND